MVEMRAVVGAQRLPVTHRRIPGRALRRFRPAAQEVERLLVGRDETGARARSGGNRKSPRYVITCMRLPPISTNSAPGYSSRDGWIAARDGSAVPPLVGPWRAGGQVAHVFTHFSLDLNLQLYSGSDWDSLAAQDGEWWPLERLDEAGLPTLFAKAARLALVGGGE